MVVTTLAGAAVGAILGSIGTHLFQIRRQNERQREKISNLRNSLLAELSCMDELLRSEHDDNPETLPIGMSIPSEVYKSNSGQLSLLTQRETEAVIRFYSGALKYQKMIEEATDVLLDDGDRDDEPPKRIHEEREAKPRVREEWVSCVLAVLEESDSYPNAIEFEGRKIEPDEDILFEDLWIFLNHTGINEKGMEVEPVNI